ALAQPRPPAGLPRPYAVTAGTVALALGMGASGVLALASLRLTAGSAPDLYLRAHSPYSDALAAGALALLAVALAGVASERRARLRAAQIEGLRRSDDRFRALASTGDHLVWTTPASGDFAQPQPGWEAFTGMAFEQYRGSLWLQAVHPDDRRRAAEAWTVAMDAETPYQVEYRVRHVDGGYRHVYAWAVPVREADGSVREWVGLHRDVTERREMGLALAASEKRYRDLFRNVPLGVYRSTPDGRVLDANPAFLALAGARTLEELDHPGAARGVYAHSARRDEFRARLVEAGEVIGFEAEWGAGGGEPRFVRESARVVRTPDGATVFEGVVEDITAVKRVERERQETLSLLRATIESTAEGILVVDLAGRIVAHNDNLVRMWSLRDEMVQAGLDERGMGLAQEMARDPKGYAARVAELYADPEATAFEVVELRDGRVLERFSGPHRMDGEIVGRVWTFRDVTDARRLEEQLAMSQKMEAVGRLAGGIAHDFNNLLTVIKGNAELVLMDLAAGSPMRDDVGEIHAAADRAALLTRQLLAFSRKQVLQPRVLDLNEVVLHADKLLRRLIGEDVELETLTDTGPGLVLADAGQLEQVLVNLVVNARDAMPAGGGRVAVRTAAVEVAAPLRRGDAQVPPGAYVELRVSDTGTGIAPELRTRVFEPFFTTKSADRGTGLGLSTVYGIVRQSGGYVWVSGEPGEGATFHVLLPRADGDAAEAEVRAAEGPAHGSETVLLVEDSPLVRDMARRSLAMHGYRVLEAANGEEGLRVCAEHPAAIELLLTDVVMPLMNGPELARQARELRPGLRVLFMSGYTDERIAGLGEAGFGLIHKPFGPGAVARKVREMLDAEAPV
ncbi:MAG: Blue-light-activated protein, partial [Gemmatimonadetes bacterium]|nr:Blue-light-activated protein [Gemmatimonadota bacterium]